MKRLKIFLELKKEELSPSMDTVPAIILALILLPVICIVVGFMFYFIGFGICKLCDYTTDTEGYLNIGIGFSVIFLIIGLFIHWIVSNWVKAGVIMRKRDIGE